jgi:hypothetical protein
MQTLKSRCERLNLRSVFSPRGALPSADLDAGAARATTTMSSHLDFVCMLLVWLGRRAQDGFDACLKFIELEGFCQEIGSAQLQGQYAIDLAMARAADENGRASQRSEGRGQVESVRVGQVQVQHDEVGLERAKEDARMGAGRGD